MHALHEPVFDLHWLEIMYHHNVRKPFCMTLSVYHPLYYVSCPYTCACYIVGKLKSVGRLQVNTNNSSTSAFISWTAPFSLDVTDEEPDIMYTLRVCVMNMTKKSSRNDTAPCTNYREIVDTNYTYELSPEHLSPSVHYLFTVIPYNGAGQGKPSHTLVTGEFTIVLTF